MEELCQRFPSIAQKIMNDVDDKTLINFKEASKITYNFLEKERFFWIRILKTYNVLYFETSKETWKKAISKTPCGIVKKLATAVITFIKKDSDYTSFLNEKRTTNSTAHCSL